LKLNTEQNISELSKVVFHYNDHTESYIVNQTYDNTGYKTQQPLVEFNVIIDDAFINKLIGDQTLNSSKVDYILHTYGVSIKLRVPKYVTQIDLLKTDITDPSGYSLITYLELESANEWNVKLNSSYQIYEDKFDRIVSISIPDVNHSNVSEVTMHTDHIKSHQGQIVTTWYDIGKSFFVSAMILESILTMRNGEVNSGFLISEDCSKSFLGGLTEMRLS